MHTNKINHKRYIGITSQKPNNRWRNGEGYKECPKFYKAIQKYGWDTFTHEILFDGLTMQEAEAKEIELIAKYKTNSKKFGYNIANGGKCRGSVSEETKKKISLSSKGKIFSKEHKKKIGASQMGEKNHMFGKHLSPEAKEKIRNANIEKPSCGAFPKKKVNQYDLNGNLIKTWDSMGEIQRKLGINHCMISECCNGKQKTSRGFIWKYWQ